MLKMFFINREAQVFTLSSSKEPDTNNTMKKISMFALFLLISIPDFAQDLYDINTIKTIDVVFAESNWDALLDAEKAGDNNYTEAVSVTINGTTFNQVGVKHKRNSSYNSNKTITAIKMIMPVLMRLCGI